MPTFTKLWSHFVWGTHNREPLIQERVEPELYAYIGGILKNRKCVLLKAGGIADHIHLLVRVHPTCSVTELCRDIKSNSSSWLRINQPHSSRFAWQEGYGAFSVSERNVDAVGQYIENQKQHHMGRTFQDELKAMLDENGISYEEKYLWK